jgi:hypothetical protein
MSSQSVESASSAAIENAVRMWTAHLRTVLSRGMSPEDIARLMVAISWDHAWLYYGSSGRRSRLYAIDDYLQLRFDFDADDALLSYAILASAKRWLKAPDGALLHDIDHNTADLQFPNEERATPRPRP